MKWSPTAAIFFACSDVGKEREQDAAALPLVYITGGYRKWA